MNKKMIAIGVVVAAVVAFLAGWYVMFVHFGRGPAFPFLPMDEVKAEGVKDIPFTEDSLVALVDTEKEAEEIAGLYEITLVSFENGVAVYRTEEDPMEVITRGQENGYPQLSLNYKRELKNNIDPNTEMDTEILFNKQR